MAQISPKGPSWRVTAQGLYWARSAAWIGPQHRSLQALYTPRPAKDSMPSTSRGSVTSERHFPWGLPAQTPRSHCSRRLVGCFNSTVACKWARLAFPSDCKEKTKERPTPFRTLLFSDQPKPCHLSPSVGMTTAPVSPCRGATLSWMALWTTLQASSVHSPMVDLHGL